ncbi:hypothetical protein [Candidatus Soleaferrea massiliensis]|uniref:hypothetical protein n=1 Tax=Candidatus Soleaferrea massiliensis TaxID=1470354 RepID=UPI0012E06D00|nr:hypothetical protein [Candidatus Soleaferrea massiliensis]
MFASILVRQGVVVLRRRSGFFLSAEPTRLYASVSLKRSGFTMFAKGPWLCGRYFFAGQRSNQERPFKEPAALVHALRVTEIRKEPMTNAPQQCSSKGGVAERPTAGGGPLENPP